MHNRNNAVVLQSGGPTAVINKSLHGICCSWQRTKAKIYGSLFGINGLLENKMIELDAVRPMKMKEVSESPSSALGSARFNLQDRSGFKNEILEKIFETFDRLGIGFCFLIGGDDSRENTCTISEYSEQIGYEVFVIHVPKTIANDLTFTHHSPGFASAAKFVVMAVTGTDLDNRSIPGVMIDVVMGRNAGWLAASSKLARKNGKMGPHFIYLPESSFSIPDFLQDIEHSMVELGRAHIVVAEGIAEKDSIIKYIDGIGGTEFLKQLCGIDDFNHPQLSGNGLLGAILCHLIKTRLKIKRVRTNTFDYLQRSFPVFSCIDQLQATMVGCKAVDLALDGANYGMVAIGSDEFHYNDEIGFVSLGKIFKNGGRKTKTVPKDIIVDNNGVSDAFDVYMGPLIDRMPVVEFLF